MTTVVNDLVTKFSFLGSVKPLGEYNVSLGGSIKLLGGVALALNAGAAAFSVWADSVLGGVDSLSALSGETGVSVAAIQELIFVAEQTQSSAGALQSTISNLAKTIGDAAQRGSDDFSRLGISVRDTVGQVKTADTILGEVANRFKALRLSTSEQQSFAGALGIDASLVQLLGKTSTEMAAMREHARELGVLTAEQTEQADRYKKSLAAMRFGISSTGQLIAVGFAPTLRGMAEDFTGLLARNRDWIVGGVSTTVVGVGNLVSAFNRLLPVLALGGAAFLLLKVHALGFAGAMALAFVPVTLTVLGISALVLIVDDLIVAFNGGQSVIADFFSEFLGVDIGPALQRMVGILQGFGDLLLSLWTDVGYALIGVFDGIGMLLTGDFVGAIDTIFDAFTTLGASIYDRVFRPLFDQLGGLIEGALPDWAVALLGGAGANRAPSTVGTLGDVPAAIPIDAGANRAGNTAVDNRRIEQSNQINVFAPDAETAGRSVADSLQKQLDDANTQLSTGGR